MATCATSTRIRRRVPSQLRLATSDAMPTVATGRFRFRSVRNSERSSPSDYGFVFYEGRHGMSALSFSEFKKTWSEQLRARTHCAVTSCLPLVSLRLSFCSLVLSTVTVGPRPQANDSVIGDMIRCYLGFVI